jgi:hypothetical protein
MKTIEITVSPEGQSRVETKGFTGDDRGVRPARRSSFTSSHRLSAASESRQTPKKNCLPRTFLAHWPLP